MRGRGPGWEEGDLQAFIKVGSDDRNFYLYRARRPLHHLGAGVRGGSGAVALVARTGRAGAAQRASGGEAGLRRYRSQRVYVACDGSYLVYSADPGVNPPNLAAIQEISAGIYRVAGSVALGDAELWVDDIRLSNPVSETGMAMSVDARLVASDVGNVFVSFVRQNGQFRQINQDPSYTGTGAFQVASAWQLDRFLPTSLGLAVPLNVSYNRTNVDPELLTGTDLRGDALAGLRKPSSSTQNYSLVVRRSRKGQDFLTRALADPFSAEGQPGQGQDPHRVHQRQLRRVLRPAGIQPRRCSAGASDCRSAGSSAGSPAGCETAMRGRAWARPSSAWCRRTSA